MEIEITIKGKVTIQDDELATFKAQDKNELANILCNNGHDVKSDVREIYVKAVK